MQGADDRNRVEATIPVEPGSEHVWTLSGKWNEEIIAQRSDTYEERVIWKANPLPYQHDHQYYFTKFAINLNTLPDNLAAKIPHTDSRHRPDQKALECGDFDRAASEKLRLEQKQREARKYRADNNIEYTAKYF